MKRDLQYLSGRSLFDVAIIGGGINGLGAALSCSIHGLRTILLERSDFGGETTAGCFRILHGGLRYLQHLDLARLRKSVGEQRAIRRMASDAVTPMPFLVPCYGHGSRSPEFLRAGGILYELFASDRNRAVRRELHLPAMRSLSREETLKLAPNVFSEGLRGSIVFYDAQMKECERVTIAVAKAASEAGAALLNYCEVTDGSVDDRGHWNLGVRDLNAGEDYTVSARAVVSAAGPWGNRISRMLGTKESGPRSFLRGTQLVLKTHHLTSGIALRGSGRSYFVTPWGEMALAGTLEERVVGEVDRFEITPSDVHELLDELRTLYPAEEFRIDNVASVFGGYIHLGDNGEAETNDILSSVKSPAPFVQVTGVKYTTFRPLAERAAREVSRLLGRSNNGGQCPEFELPVRLPGQSGARIASGIALTVPQAEAIAREESVVHLSDIVFRRTSLALEGVCDLPFLRALAIVVARTLGWSDSRMEEEVKRCAEALERSYALRASGSSAEISPRRNIS